MKIFPKLAQHQNIAMKDRQTHLEFKSALMFAEEDKVSHQFFLKAISGTWESFSNANILHW